MSNRFHSKWHRTSHHTYPNVNNPDAGHDPIASKEQPFLGEFVLSGALSAVAPLSAFAGYFYSNNTAICAVGGIQGMFITGTTDAIQAFSQNLAISAYSPKLGIYVASPQKAIIATAGNIGLEVYSSNRAISANGVFVAGEFYSNNIALSAFGKNIGASFYSTNIPLSTGFGMNILGGYVGINNSTPTSALQVTGASRFDGNVRILGNTRIDSDLTIFGNLSTLGSISYLDTIVTVTSAMTIQNTGTGPALTVTQTGDQAIAQFFDDAGQTALMVEGHNAKPGWVGIGNSSPNMALSVTGSISATGNNFSNALYSGSSSFTGPLSALSVLTTSLTSVSATITGPLSAGSLGVYGNTLLGSTTANSVIAAGKSVANTINTSGPITLVLDASSINYFYGVLPLPPTANVIAVSGNTNAISAVNGGSYGAVYYLINNLGAALTITTSANLYCRGGANLVLGSGADSATLVCRGAATASVH